ncbi:MAG: hypothetical protein ACI4PQ_05140 [Butyricicoccaceae bacterium]
MRRARYILAVLLCLCALSGSAWAAEDVWDGQKDLIGADSVQNALDGQTRSLLGDLDISSEIQLGDSLIQLVQKTENERSQAVKSAVSTLARIAVVLLFCGCAAGFGAASRLPGPILPMAGALGVTAVIYGDLNGLMSLCMETIESMNVFSSAMMPVMASAITISGAPATAALTYSVTMFVFDLTVSLISNLLVPAVNGYIAVITVNAAIGNDMLARMAAFLKWVVSGTLKILLTGFVAYITISGTVSHGLDNSTVKAAKFALSGTVPIVGSIISGATDTLLSGAILLKNALGVFGMICIAAICIIPFLRVGISYLIFKAGTAVLSPVTPPQLAKLMEGITSGFGMLLGMLGSCASILFFELVFAVTMVNTI